MKNKYLLLFCAFTFAFSEVSFAQTSAQEKREKEILHWIEQLSSNPENAGFHLGYNYDTEAITYILKPLKSENPKVKAGAYGAIYLIIRKNFRKGEEIPWKELDFSLFPEDLKKDLKEAIRIASKDVIENPDPKIRTVAINFLHLFGGREVKTVLKKCFEDPNLSVRSTAVHRLAKLGENYNIFEVLIGKEPKTPEEYIKYLGDPHLRIPVIKALKGFSKEAISALMNVASENKEPDRRIAISLLGELKAEEAIPLYVTYLQEEVRDETTYSLQSHCVHSLLAIDTEEAVEMLKQNGLRNKNPKIQLLTADMLIEKEKEESLSVLMKLSKSQDSHMKFRTAMILIRNYKKAGIPVLIELLKDPTCASDARIILEGATKQDFGKMPRGIITQKMLDDYVNKWQGWWEENKETFEFPEK